MKTKRNKSLAVMIAVFLILFAVMTIIGIPTQPNAAKADIDIYAFTGTDPNLTLSQKSSAIAYPSISAKVPMLTVLVPDINENASVWSNNYFKGGFSYNAEYLPEQMASTYSNVQLYSAFFENSDLYIKLLQNEDFVLEKDEIKSSEGVFSNFSDNGVEHKVILINFSKKKGNFALAYAELNKLITLVLYDLKKSTALNASVNIIGHGRGGLLGIKYANDHPTAVNALYNIGTPHNGADTLKLFQMLKQYGANLQKPEEILGGSNIYEFADGNSSLLSQLKSAWNNVTVVQNPDIKAYSFAGAIDRSHFAEISRFASIAEGIKTEMDMDDYLVLLFKSKRELTKKYLGENEYKLLSRLYTISKDSDGVDYHKPVVELLIDGEFLGELVNNYFYLILKHLDSNIIKEWIENESDGNELTKFGVSSFIIFGLNTLKSCYDTYKDMYPTGQTFGESLDSILNSNIILTINKQAAKTVYSVLSKFFSDDELFENTANRTVGYFLSKTGKVDKFLEDLTNAKNDIVKVGKFADTVAKVMACLPTALAVTAVEVTGLVIATYPSVFVPGLIGAGMATAAIFDQVNNQAISQFLDDVKLRDYTEFNNDGANLFFTDEILFMSDFLVSYDSQIAQGYEKFEHTGKIFSDKEIKLNKSSLGNIPFPVAHYLQTMDVDFINKIMETIEINNPNMLDYNFILDDLNKTATITGVRNLNLSDNGTLVLPDELLNYTVNKIGEGAFKEKSISSVVLPSGLEEIGAEAFLGCGSLTAVSLPSTLIKIGERAFLECALGTVGIGENVSEIGELAFGKNSVAFTVDSGNAFFMSSEGSLYDKLQKVLIKYGGTGSSLTLPSSVEEIADFAFYGNNLFTTISLPGVKKIGKYAFYQSGLSTVNYSSAVESVGECAFEGTSWLNANCVNGFFILNNRLVRYKDVEGVTDITVPSNVTRIFSKAFKGSTVHSIRFPAGLQYIEGRILEDCVSIERVEFRGQITPTVEGLLTDGTGNMALKIYVPYSYRNLYEENLSYLKSYNGPFYNICNVRYYDITDPDYYITQEFTDEDLPLAINVASPRSDLTFAGWSDNSNSFSGKTTILSAEQDINLYAFYKYPVTFVLDNGEADVTQSVIYHDYFSFPTPVKEGYYLSGWNNLTNEGSYLASTTSWQLNNDLTATSGWTIKAEWAPNRYELKVEENGGWWIYLDNDSLPALSSSVQWIRYGDQINKSLLIQEFKSHGLGFRTGYTLVGFSFTDPSAGSGGIDGPSNGATTGEHTSFTVPYMGEDGNTVTVTGEFDNADDLPGPSNAPLSSDADSYYLYALYEPETYYIKLYLNNQLQNAISGTYTYGDLLPELGYIADLHCDFVKWSTQSLDSLAPSAATPDGPYDSSTIYDFTPGQDLELFSSNPLILYALLRRRCEVKFKNFDGSVIKTEYVLYGGDATPPAVSRLGYKFDGWDYSYSNVNSENLVCTAQFSRSSYIISNNYSGTMTFSDYAVYVDCSNPIKGALYKIASSVNVITFEDYSNTTGLALLANNFQRIEVLNRSTPITIILINYYSIALNTYNGIYGSSATVNLYCIGENVITGGVLSTSGPILDYSSAGIYTNTINITGESGASLTVWGGIGNTGAGGIGYSNIAADNSIGANGGDGANGYDGGYGIVCVNLHISNINVTITGGTGGFGGAGGKGQQAGKITTVPTYGVVGTTGKKGGDGGNGGNGGNGKGAVLLYGGTFKVDSTATVTLTGGNGGIGGNGGDGGKGGTGGKGGPGKFGKAAAKGGTGGNGGDGGNGGNGGIGGLAVVNVFGTLDFATGSVTQNDGSSARGGTGGNGGAGGNGGEGGTKWPTGNLASTGNTGNSGAAGTNGASGN